MHITFLTRKSALIYSQRVASLTLDCNGVFAIRAYNERRRHSAGGKPWIIVTSINERIARVVMATTSAPNPF